MRASPSTVGSLIAVLVLSACTGGQETSGAIAQQTASAAGASSSAPSPVSTPGAAPPAPTAAAEPPPTAEQLSAVLVRARRLAKFDHPTAVAQHQGDLYVTERAGRLRVLTGETGKPRTVLDLRKEVATQGEQGLLGLAFSPDGTRLYLSYIDRRGDNRLVEYGVQDRALMTGSRRDVLRVDQPATTHVGGQVSFGPDGLLWVGIGEGGAPHTDSGGHAHATPARGLDTLLGTILRIDPRPSGGNAYTVPTDNPYANRAGARPEVWAYGMRNPWRWSIDRVDRELWIGDVGEYKAEEINRLRLDEDAGAHLGWPYLEGSRKRRTGKPPEPQVRSLLDYGHNGRCSVIGGYVYRGTRIPGLAGAYLFSDFCDGKVRALSERNGEVVAEQNLGVDVGRVVSFGEDAQGELFVLSSSGSVFRLEGK